MENGPLQLLTNYLGGFAYMYMFSRIRYLDLGNLSQVSIK